MSGSHQRSSSTWHCVSPERGNRDSPQAGRSAESNDYLRVGVWASDRERPLVAGANCTVIARRSQGCGVPPQLRRSSPWSSSSPWYWRECACTSRSILEPEAPPEAIRGPYRSEWCHANEMCEQGNAGEAADWYRKAADGDAVAMFYLGVLLDEQGNAGEAEDWYRKAAAAGNPR
jgi:hypothetical protein